LAIPVGLFVVKQITDRIDKEPATPIPDKPLIKNGFVTGPAAGAQDFNLLPKIKVTQEQLAKRVGDDIDLTGIIDDVLKQIPGFDISALGEFKL
jgi:hypothetical protein